MLDRGPRCCTAGHHDAGDDHGLEASCKPTTQDQLWASSFIDTSSGTERTCASPDGTGASTSDHGAVDVVLSSVLVYGGVDAVVNQSFTSQHARVSSLFNWNKSREVELTKNTGIVADKGAAGGDGVQDCVESQSERCA